jgi:hypothetical protein
MILNAVEHKSKNVDCYAYGGVIGRLTQSTANTMRGQDECYIRLLADGSSADYVQETRHQ